MLITAKQAEPRSGKSVREVKQPWSNIFCNCLAEKYCYSWARCCPPSSTPLALPSSLSSFQAQMRHCRICSSPLCLPLGSSAPLFWELVTAAAAVGRTQTRCPLWMPFCSPWHCFCSLLYHTNTSAFHSSAWEGVAVEQAWSARGHWHIFMEKLLKVIKKIQVFLCWGHRRSCDKIWKSRIVWSQLDCAVR